MKPTRPQHARSAAIEVLEQRIAPATFIVTNTSDTGEGSLREAITQANFTLNTGGIPDEIHFAIPDNPFIIRPLTPLPEILEAVVIDGYSQPGTMKNTAPSGRQGAQLLIVLDGSLLTAPGNGLVLGGPGGSIVTGLVIHGFTRTEGPDSGYGILIRSDNNGVYGNFIGTDTTARVAVPNANGGISVGDASENAYRGNIIGGPGDRINLLSGNGTGIVLQSNSGTSVVVGNLIGLDAAGTGALPNGTGIVDRGIDNRIGGAVPNFISGNSGSGIRIEPSATSSIIQGNVIGITSALQPLGNQDHGIHILGSSGNIIGGAEAGQGNLISENRNAGIAIIALGIGNALGNSITGNTIGDNGGAGVLLVETQGGLVDGTTISRNLISGNGGLGISFGGGTTAIPNDPLDADTGINGLQNHPVFNLVTTTAFDTTFVGTLQSTPNTDFSIEIFYSPMGDPSGFGEGAEFVRSVVVTTDGTGTAPFTVNVPGRAFASGAFSATATNTQTGSTSEFGPNFELAPGGLTFIWDNSAGTGDWFNPLNWDRDNGVPGPADTAILNIASTINLTANVSVGTFNQSAGTIAGGPALGLSMVAGGAWTGGLVQANLSVPSGATFAISGTSPKNLRAGLSVGGTATLSGAALDATGGTITIESSGLLDLLDDTSIIHAGGGGSLISNAGLVRKSGGTGMSSLNPTDFINTGTVQVQSGTLLFNNSGFNGFAFDGRADSLVSAATGATALFAGPATFTGSTFSGDGSKRYDGGTNNLTFNGSIAANTFDLASGNLLGNATLNGRLAWVGGFINATLNFPTGSIFQITGALGKSLRGAHTMGGTMTVSGAALDLTGGTITIESSGLLDLQGDTSIVHTGGGGSLISNAGIVRKSGGTGMSSLSPTDFINTGTVQALTGTLRFNNSGFNGFAFRSEAGSSVFTGAGATLELLGSATLVDASIGGAGAAIYASTSGTLTTNGAIFSTDFAIQSGNWMGTATISGRLLWQGGLLLGSPTISSSGVLLLDGPAVKTVAGSANGITNQGIVTFTGDGNLDFQNGAFFNNADGATLLIETTGSLTHTGGGTSTFTNAGTVRKTASTGTNSIGNTSVTNTGFVSIESGTLAFPFAFTQTAGSTHLAGGSLGGGITFNFQGGNLVGSGSIAGNINNTGATVRPDTTESGIGSIVVSGDYSQGSSGILIAKIGGTAPGQFDTLTISGSATIDGTLDVRTFSGFQPADGDSFEIVSAAGLSGNFFTLLTEGPGYTQLVGAESITIEFGGTGPSLVVDTVLDVVDSEDGVTSLREAILFANSTPGLDIITFDLPGPGPHTILLSSALPAITDAVVIDGYSQPGANPAGVDTGPLVLAVPATLQIVLSGANAGPGSHGLSLEADGSTVRGLSIGGFDGAGIRVFQSGSHTISGNHIGLAPNGATATPNRIGVVIESGRDTIIGGPLPGDRNIISGNFSESAPLQDGSGILIFGNNSITNQITGNFIGTDAAGLSAVPNSRSGVAIFDPGNNFNLVTRNVISGNLAHGVDIAFGASLNSVRGNLIGVAANGFGPLGNTGTGVLINSGSNNNAIGGSALDERNIVAYNSIGIAVGGTSVGNAFRNNSIFSNLSGGIDLGSDGFTPNDPAPDADIGPNRLQNFPVLSAVLLDLGVVSVNATLETVPNSTFVIEFYAGDNPDGNGVVQGRRLLGTATAMTDGAGLATFGFSTADLASFELITATATNLTTGDTSEFAVGALPTSSGATISISRGVLIEGDSGSQPMRFVVRLSEPVSTPVTVNFATSDWTALAGSDYAAASGMLTFDPGEIEQEINISIFGDTQPEQREYFRLTLSGASGAAIAASEALGTSIDEDQSTFAVGEGSGGKVVIYQGSGSGAQSVATFEPFGTSFKGGVRVATGDVTGDGIDDIIIGGGNGSRGVVRVYDGTTFEPVAGALGSVSAFGQTFRGGVYVAAGDVDGDGHADVIVSPAAGSSTQVRVFSGADGSLINSFTAFPGMSGGVRVAVGDLNGDGLSEIIVGVGSGSRVRIFDGESGSPLEGSSASFNVFEKRYKRGVFVAAGDVNGDGIDDLIASAGAGVPRVKVFTSAPGESQPIEFQAYPRAPFLGARVSLADVNGDGIADIIAARGGTGAPEVRAFSGIEFASIFSLKPFEKQRDGVFVG
jgi:hypothetical protein